MKYIYYVSRLYLISISLRRLPDKFALFLLRICIFMCHIYVVEKIR